MKPVTVRRWEIVASFMLLVLVAVGVAWWNDHRIDNAQRRIARNTTLAVRAEVTAQEAKRQNALQNRIRAVLVRDLCDQIESLKTNLRVIVLRSDASLEQLRGQIDPDLIERAHRQNRAALRDLAPSRCVRP